MGAASPGLAHPCFKEQPHLMSCALDLVEKAVVLSFEVVGHVVLAVGKN